jgi:hypothetical protein
LQRGRGMLRRLLCELEVLLGHRAQLRRQFRLLQPLL